MQEFAKEFPDELPSIEPKKLFSSFRHPSINPKQLKKYLALELTRLNEEWFHYIADLNDDEEDMKNATYVEGKVDALFDLINNFNLDNKQFLNYIPDIEEYAAIPEEKEEEEEIENIDLSKISIVT